MKLVLILVFIGFVSSGDPCKEGLDDSICTDGAKTGRLVARFQDAEAGGCSPYSPFILKKKYRCNDVSTYRKIDRIWKKAKFEILKIFQKHPDPPADAEVCYYCKYGRNDWKLVKTCNNLTCGGKKGNKLSCDCTDYVEWKISRFL